MLHRKALLPIDLAKVGIDGAVNHLTQYDFLLVLSAIESLPDGLPSASTMEKQLAVRHLDPLRQSGFLARRRIARAILASRLGLRPETIEIGESETGAPVLLSPQAAFHLSFSARGPLALIGLARQPIGVDLERITPDMLIPWNVLRADERMALEALPPQEQPEAFCTLWSAKEAIVKAMGVGFRLAPEAIHLKGWPGDGTPEFSGISGTIQPASAGIELCTHRMDLNLGDKLLEADKTGGFVVAAARIA
jgi:phosphopantetheinyl transferase